MEFIKPGPNKRVCAFIIDISLASCFGILLSVVFQMKAAYWIFWLAYMFLKDYFNGQSAGKFLVGIQVRDEEGALPSIVKVIIRNLFLIIPLMPVVEYWVALKNKEGRRAGDKVAKTRVHDLRPKIKDIVFLWFSVLFAVIFAAIQVALAAYVFKRHPQLFYQLYGRW